MAMEFQNSQSTIQTKEIHLSSRLGLNNLVIIRTAKMQTIANRVVGDSNTEIIKLTISSNRNHELKNASMFILTATKPTRISGIDIIS